MDVLELVKKRRSIRKYSSKQISHEAMVKILEAGTYAPNAGGGQRSYLVGIRDEKIVRRIGRLNFLPFDRSKLLGGHVSDEQPSVIDDSRIEDGFYGAPAVVVLFGQADFPFSVADAFCSAENMVLMATDMGLGSCIISRGEETFITDEGKALLKEWKVPSNYICRAFVILGYIDGEYPKGKPRRPGRVMLVE
ncbi:MAG: nitroreductase family protein [Anaerovibrio sp.]|uniref:nitroreductase family protein n=1 Tax=Anaerovibrio sp. TaxID=1872532 RepID=UPI0025DCCC09|nr:nitroreductase family protein [Anaerovibrio sp.]MCR5176155.1 nitroreductase family protein [Anaerovibrio sp.]